MNQQAKDLLSRIKAHQKLFTERLLSDDFLPVVDPKDEWMNVNEQPAVLVTMLNLNGDIDLIIIDGESHARPSLVQPPTHVFRNRLGDEL